MTNFVYRPPSTEFGLENSNYVVGYYTPKGSWIPVEEFAAKGSATDYVSYLNGGIHPEVMYVLNSIRDEIQNLTFRST